MLAGCTGIGTRELNAGCMFDQLPAARSFKAYGDKSGEGFMNPGTWIKLNYAGNSQKPA